MICSLCPIKSFHIIFDISKYALLSNANSDSMFDTSFSIVLIPINKDAHARQAMIAAEFRLVLIEVSIDRKIKNVVEIWKSVREE